MKNLKTMRDRLRFVYVWYLCYLMPNYHLNTPFTEKKSWSFSLVLKYSIPQSHALFICFLKTFIEFVTIFFLGLFVCLFNVLGFLWPQDMCDLSSSTKNQTHRPCVGRGSPTH